MATVINMSTGPEIHATPSVPSSLDPAGFDRTELAIDHLSDARKTPLKG